MRESRFKLGKTLLILLLFPAYIIIFGGLMLYNKQSADSDTTSQTAYVEMSLARRYTESFGDVYLASGEKIIKNGSKPVLSEYDRLNLSLGSVYGYYDCLANPSALDESVSGQIELYTTAFQRKNNGYDVVLSLDGVLQQALYDMLDSTQGQGVLLNYKTGEILACVSSQKDVPLQMCFEEDAYTFDSSERVLYEQDAGCNSVLQEQISPGSLMKPVVAAALLNAGEEAALCEFTGQCSAGTEEVGTKGKTLKCYQGNAHGEVDLETALSQSCNKFLIDYIDQKNVSRETLLEELESMGIGGANSFHLSSFYMRTGMFNSSEDTMYLSTIGQGDCKVSLLSLAAVYQAFANGGVTVAPRFLQSYGSDGKYKNITVKKKRILSVEHAGLINEILKKTVTDGTARSLSSRFGELTLSAKTGSAEYEDGSTHKLCISYSNHEEYPYLFAEEIPETEGQALDITGRLWSFLEQQ